MDKKNLLQRIKQKARIDEKNRNDLRFKRTMAFLVKKGFLKTNDNYEPFYRARMFVDEMIWAGKNVEPRILEVLPAAVARLPKAFIWKGKSEENLALLNVVHDLINKNDVGHDFLMMPYNKIKIWMNIPLDDKRTKTEAEKKKMATFRLNLKSIQKLKQLADKLNLSEANVIQKLIETASL